MSPRSALAVAFALALLSAAARGGERRFDPRVREMLRRARSGEEPTAEDQRSARRALRNWKLSERSGVPGDRRIGRLLRDIADGREPAAHLRPVADGIYEHYLTPNGYQRSMDEAVARGGARPPTVGGPGTIDDPPGSAQYWFLFATCLAIMVGGVVVWALGRRLRKTDHRAYYS